VSSVGERVCRRRAFNRLLLSRLFQFPGGLLANRLGFWLRALQLLLRAFERLVRALQILLRSLTLDVRLSQILLRALMIGMSALQVMVGLLPIGLRALEFFLGAIALGVRTLQLVVRHLSIRLRPLRVRLRALHVGLRALQLGLRALAFGLRAFEIRLHASALGGHGVFQFTARLRGGLRGAVFGLCSRPCHGFGCGALQFGAGRGHFRLETRAPLGVDVVELWRPALFGICLGPLPRFLHCLIVWIGEVPELRLELGLQLRPDAVNDAANRLLGH
jgi:hypothetical protein